MRPVSESSNLNIGYLTEQDGLKEVRDDWHQTEQAD